MEMSTYFVLGYCRSTFGGFDVWSADRAKKETTRVIETRRLEPNTTINKMNYAGLVCCLDHILTTVAPTIVPTIAPTAIKENNSRTITVICGCFLVCQHMNGGYQTAKLRMYYNQAKAKMDELALNGVTVVLAYDPDIRAPLPLPLLSSPLSNESGYMNGPKETNGPKE